MQQWMILVDLASSGAALLLWAVLIALVGFAAALVAWREQA